jgi:hypothetical protein
VRAVVAQLDAQTAATLIQGRLDFPTPVAREAVVGG